MSAFKTRVDIADLLLHARIFDQGNSIEADTKMSFNTYWSKSLAQWILVLGNVEIQDVHETTKAVKPKLLNQSFQTAIEKLKLSTCELVRRLWLKAWRGDIAGALLTPTNPKEQNHRQSTHQLN